ncbi:hypothetical protein EC988_008266, partial [Linderina pennispora]
TLQTTIAPHRDNQGVDPTDKEQTAVASSNEALPEPEQTTWKISRLKLFWIAFTLSFVYYFVPGWFFTTLTMVPVLCLIAPNNIYANQLGDGYNGLGMLAFSLDWSTISNAYTGSPLATPWFAAANLFLGFAIFMWVITPIVYYSDSWDSKTFPIYSSQLYRQDGSPYNVSSVLKDGRLDAAAYDAYGPMRMSVEFLAMYGVCFAGIPCLLVHVLLNHGQNMWATMQQIKNEVLGH